LVFKKIRPPTRSLKTTYKANKPNLFMWFSESHFPYHFVMQLFSFLFLMYWYKIDFEFTDKYFLFRMRDYNFLFCLWYLIAGKNVLPMFVAN
jgi:hypothetical protein